MLEAPLEPSETNPLPCPAKPPKAKPGQAASYVPRYPDTTQSGMALGSWTNAYYNLGDDPWD